ncbi:MAG: hypothetical protein LBU98_05935 [Alistipes sp.]|nr:hypothetical protein [Alistipes sp.]
MKNIDRIINCGGHDDPRFGILQEHFTGATRVTLPLPNLAGWKPRT